MMNAGKKMFIYSILEENDSQMPTIICESTMTQPNETLLPSNGGL